jgi:hypothetical protein
VALGVLAGSVVSAAVVNADTGSGPIRACVTDQGGAVSVVSDPTGYTRNPSTCGAGTHELDWNQQGPTGPAGATGPAGPAGPAGAAGSSGLTLWARVLGNGTLIAASPSGVRAYYLRIPGSKAGTIITIPAGSPLPNGKICMSVLGCSVVSPGGPAKYVGSYAVDFGFDVSHCAFTATPIDGADSTVAATAENGIKLGGGSVDNRTVEVSVHHAATTHFVPKSGPRVTVTSEEPVPSSFLLIGTCTG